MNMLMRCKIRLEDARFVPLFEDYTVMVGTGEKVTYVVATLAEKYCISQRKVYQIIKRMGKDCTEGAVTKSPDSWV